MIIFINIIFPTPLKFLNDDEGTLKVSKIKKKIHWYIYKLERNRRVVYYNLPANFYND